MKARLLALFLAGAAAALASDTGFDRLVKAVEFHYSVKRTKIPLMGLANFVVKVKHPAGTKEFKLALFENLNASDDPAAMDRILQELAGKGLRPMLRQKSRGGEAAVIFASESGNDMRMLIATFSHSEAAIVELKVDSQRMVELIEQPGLARRGWRSGDDDRQEIIGRR